MDKKCPKIIVINPPFLPRYSRASRSPAVAKSNTLYYPIWLAYATGILEKEGFDVKLIDAPAMNWDRDKVYQFAKSFKPDLIVVDTTTASIYSDIEIADNLGQLTEGLTFLVGTHASALPHHSLDETKYVNGIAIGEYDYTLRDLALALRENHDWREVAGIAFREAEEIKFNDSREKITDLDSLPFVSEVYKNQLGDYIDKYFYGANRYPVITIVSGRGCPHRCSYCVYPQIMFGHQYRVRSVKNLVDELEYIKNNFPQVQEVFLEDDTLTVNKQRVLEVCREIRKRGLKITWSTNSRAQVDYQTLRKMKQAGCRLLCVGFESASQQILDNIHKNLRVEEIYKFVKNAKRAGILIHGCFLVGNPGETKETLEQTLEMAKKLNTDTAQFYPIMVYPGTQAYDWAKNNNYLMTQNFRDWITQDGLHSCVVSTPKLSSEDLLRWCDRARKEYYLRPSYMVSKLVQSMRHPSELSRLARGFKSLSRFILKESR